MSSQELLIGSPLRSFLAQHAAPPSSGPLVLIWELGGFPAILRKNAILAAALQLRGCRTHMIVCDGTPIACIQRSVEENDPLQKWAHRCAGCRSKCAQTAELYGVQYSNAGDYVPEETSQELRRWADSLPLADILDFKHWEVPVGQLAWSSLNRYLKGYSYAVASLPEEHARAYRAYFFAALVNTETAFQAMAQWNPDGVLTSHGVYVDYAPALFLAHLHGRRTVSWASGYADYLHYFTVPKDSNRVVVRGLRDETWLQRAASPLTPREDRRLDAFLRQRYFKQQARDIRISSAPEDSADLRKRLGIRNDRPVVCLFAHVNWDACFDFSTMIFPTANDWVVESLRRMISMTDVNWIVRVHPGEITDGSVLSTGDLILQEFPHLPDHVRVLWSDSEINSYGLYQMIDAGITIFGTVGIEITAMGKPVIVAGEAHYSGKGFTCDARSYGEYFNWLDRCREMVPLTQSQTQLARQYAYSFFIQRQIPLTVTQGHWGDLDPTKLQCLLPGHDEVMDLLCARILDGHDLILPETVLSRLYPESTGEEVLSSSPAGPSLTVQLLEGHRLFESKDWCGALTKFDSVLHAQPDRRGVHLMRARCYTEMGQLSRAREAAEAELRLQPNHPDALQILIRLTKAKGAPLSPTNEPDMPLLAAQNRPPSRQGLRFKIRVPLLPQPSSSLQGSTDSPDPGLPASTSCGVNEAMSMKKAVGFSDSQRPLSKLLGFDSAGEVFTDGRRILRGIFPGKAPEVQKALSLYQRCGLSSRGLVKTTEVSENWSQLGYDMVLEHERVPFITYAHEWPAEMLKESALLQIDLAQELDRSGFVLKDSGASGNVLFHGPRPVFVDFLSILPKEDLERQEWLKPRGTASVFQPLWSSRSSAFHEIYRRMFFPYVLYPLHMQHQKRHEETRQRLLATTLNTCFEVISHAEAFAQATPEQERLHTVASASRELALVRDDCQGFLRALRCEVERLKSGVESSSYSNYYELKREAFGFEPCAEWLPKQRGVYEVLKRLKPATVLDIGANTGWFSILAARQNCQVVAMDNDEASMNLLFHRAKQEDLSILPLVMDFCKPSVDVDPFPGYEKDEHSRNSRIPGEVPLLLSMEKRLKCDLVLALAIVHHLTLGKGLSLEAVVAQLAGLAEKHLVMEFVPKEDPLIVREPEFFQAYRADPNGFSWYTQENWLKALGRCFSRIEQRDSAPGRTLLICSR